MSSFKLLNACLFANLHQKPKDKADCSSKPDHAKCSSKPETKKNGGTSEAIKERWSQCKRAKACALYDHKGGLVEHYNKLWEYRHVVLESNPGVITKADWMHVEELEGVENKDNWVWFLSLLQEDLELGYGGGLTVLFYGHKFLQKMEQIKDLDPAAHKWLVERNLNSWFRVFFEMDRCSATFKNGISVSIIGSYQQEKETGISEGKAKYCLVYPSGYRKVEVRRGDVAYGVNLHTKKHGCNFWELSGIPCVYSMAAYYHMNMDLELGVNEFFSKQSWYNAYQYSIRPVLGSKLWKPCDNPSPLPLIERKRPDRPRKQRIRHPTKDDNHVSRVDSIKFIDGSIQNNYRIRSPIKRGEDNQVIKGGSMGDGNLTAEEYQHKMDMEALAEAVNEANDLYWENYAKEFRDSELNRPKDSLEAAYSFDIISEYQDNELNVHQVSMDLPVNEAPENYTTEESQAQDLDPAPTLPTQERSTTDKAFDVSEDEE
ncbi:hypothetical protein Tco_1330401 [Tanacetum coccineum]